MERKLEIGGVVVFIDAHRMEQKALITCIHGDPLGRGVNPVRKAATELTEDEKEHYELDGHRPPIYAYKLDENGCREVEYTEPGSSWPCINLIIVSPNDECQDQYGRQLERHTSVVHQSNSSAQGYCFRFEDEVLDRSLRQPTVS
jgi:hypothetical protein